MLNKINY